MMKANVIITAIEKELNITKHLVKRFKIDLLLGLK